MNAPYYNQDVAGNEDLTARYLQQDTMGLQGNAVMSDVLTIFVMDSLPRFIAYRPDSDNSTPSMFKVKKANYYMDAPFNAYDSLPYS